MLRSMENMAVQSLQILCIFVLRMEIVTIFGRNVTRLHVYFSPNFCNFANNFFFSGIFFDAQIEETKKI